MCFTLLCATIMCTVLKLMYAPIFAQSSLYQALLLCLSQIPKLIPNPATLTRKSPVLMQAHTCTHSRFLTHLCLSLSFLSFSLSLTHMCTASLCLSGIEFTQVTICDTCYLHIPGRLQKFVLQSKLFSFSFTLYQHSHFVVEAFFRH